MSAMSSGGVPSEFAFFAGWDRIIYHSPYISNPTTVVEWVLAKYKPLLWLVNSTKSSSDSGCPETVEFPARQF